MEESARKHMLQNKKIRDVTPLLYFICKKKHICEGRNGFEFLVWEWESHVRHNLESRDFPAQMRFITMIEIGNKLCFRLFCLEIVRLTECLLITSWIRIIGSWSLFLILVLTRNLKCKTSLSWHCTLLIFCRWCGKMLPRPSAPWSELSQVYLDCRFRFKMGATSSQRMWQECTAKEINSSEFLKSVIKVI